MADLAEVVLTVNTRLAVLRLEHKPCEQAIVRVPYGNGLVLSALVAEAERHVCGRLRGED